MTIDTVREIITPEGCVLELRIAGPVARARAWLYDFLVRLVLWIIISTIIGMTGKAGLGFFLVASFVVEWFYPILFEVYMGGQTPGKRICDLVVLHDDGRPVGWNASLIRNTVRFVDFLPFLYAVGFVACLLNAHGKRLGDLAAGTVVTHGEPRPGKAAAPAAAPETGSEPPPFPLTLEEQQAVIEYHHRVGQFTDERALELAALPTPLTGNLPPQQGRRRLLRIGNFLLGGH